MKMVRKLKQVENMIYLLVQTMVKKEVAFGLFFHLITDSGRVINIPSHKIGKEKEYIIIELDGKKYPKPEEE